MSRYLEKRGSYDLASTLVEQALELYESVLGKEHMTLASMINMVWKFTSQGRHDVAKEVNGRALELSQRVLGKEYPYTQTSMADFASIYRSQGR